MQKLANLIMRHKTIIIITFVVLMILSVVGVLFVDKESDLIAYLDKDSDTIVSKKILETEYDIIGDCNLAISYVTKDEVAAMIEQFKANPKINDYLAKDPVWIGTFDSLDNSMLNGMVDYEQALANAKEKFVKQTEYTYQTVIDGKETQKKEIIDTYIVSLYFKTAGGDQETIDALDAIDEILQSENGIIQKHINAQDGVGPSELTDWYFIGGNAQNARNILKSSLGDMPKFVLVAVAVCLVILLLTTQSYLEPLIFLATLGVSILLNMGTNIIAGNPMGKISSITSSCATILQLAIAMDYSIFLMHTYYEELKLHPQPKDALIAALPKTISAISASMLTTVGGFLALFFMDYGIGYDLGFVLAKGVILSLLSTVFLQPILILILSKGIKKTKHKWIFAPKLKFVSKGITHPAVAAIVVVLVLGFALPCSYFQLQVPLSYVATSVDNPNPNLPETMASSINNQAIVLVPYEGIDSIDKHYSFVEKVRKIGYELDEDGNVKFDENGAVVSKDVSHVTEVFSLATILSKDDVNHIENPSGFGQQVAASVIKTLLYTSFIANYNTQDGKQQYMLYTITLNNTNDEGKVTNRIETPYSYNALKEIKFAAMEAFENYDLRRIVVVGVDYLRTHRAHRASELLVGAVGDEILKAYLRAGECIHGKFRFLLRQVERESHLPHLLFRHSVGFVPHALGIYVYLRRLAEHIHLIESLHYVAPHGAHSMLLPQHHVVLVELRDGGVGQLLRPGKTIRHDAESARTESLGLGNHAPQQIGQDILFEKFGRMRHRDQLDGVGMQGRLVVEPLTQ